MIVVGNNDRKVVVLRHGPYIPNARDEKSFWQKSGSINLDKFDVNQTVEQIKPMINGYALKKVYTTTVSRAMATANLVALELGVKINSSAELNPLFVEWEEINDSADFNSVMSVAAMYEEGSPSKLLLMKEGYRFKNEIEYILKFLKQGEAVIIVSHSPLVEALESALNENWDTVPKTLEKGEAKEFLFTL